jgi:hypothetical protein
MTIPLSPLLVLTLAPLLIALVLLGYALGAARRGRWGGAVSRLLTVVVLLLVAGLFGAISLATHGFRVFTEEAVAATVEIRNLEPQLFNALFTFPDGRQSEFQIMGDQLYVDAQIIKWHPLATAVGLRTAYQLERVGGRYLLLDYEQTRPRTVYALAQATPLNLSDLVSRFTPLTALIDAEYGSATFVPVEDGARFAIMVSHTGLLARRLE